jgi:hypothetical protein
MTPELRIWRPVQLTLLLATLLLLGGQVLQTYGIVTEALTPGLQTAILPGLPKLLLLIAAMAVAIIGFWRPSRMLYGLGLLSGLILLEVTVQFLTKQGVRYELFYLMEKAAYAATPALLAWALLQGQKHQGVLWGLRIVVALTFMGHGLYAIGIPYGVPSNFVDMVRLDTAMIGMGLAHTQSYYFLKLVGLIDLVVSALILLPTGLKLFRKLYYLSLSYMILWGLLTAMARPMAIFAAESFSTGVFHWSVDVLVRAPHFLLPLALIVLRLRERAQKASEPEITADIMDVDIQIERKAPAQSTNRSRAADREMSHHR